MGLYCACATLTQAQASAMGMSLDFMDEFSFGGINQLLLVHSLSDSVSHKQGAK